MRAARLSCPHWRQFFRTPSLAFKVNDFAAALLVDFRRKNHLLAAKSQVPRGQRYVSEVTTVEEWARGENGIFCQKVVSSFSTSVFSLIGYPETAVEKD